jgi:hypothetical protein
MEKDITFGRYVAASVLPFMTGKHTVSSDECIDMIRKPVDRKIAEKDRVIRALLYFQEHGQVTFKGLNWKKGINEKGFYETITSYLETATP